MPDDIHHDRRGFLGTAAMTIAAAQLGMHGGLMPQLTRAAGARSASPGEGITTKTGRPLSPG